MRRRSRVIASMMVMAGVAAMPSPLTDRAAMAGDARHLVDRDRHLFQGPTPSITRVRDLKPVEQTIEDIGPLGTSIRHMHTGLRQPSGFEDIFRVPGDDDRFVRVDGGLYAVFPRSAYLSTEDGEFPLIPANTVFWIGMPDFLKHADHPVRNKAAEEVWRLFALQPEAVLVPTLTVADGSFAERLRVADGDRVPSVVEALRSRREGQAGSSPRRDVRYRTISRDRSLVHDDGEPEMAEAATEAEVETVEERDQFRRRVRELLRQAAEAEKNGGPGN